ncbi:hypothetical protein CRG98_027434 [Punica granatum]|uniref:Uncharacterized protein n=1 Tax=Punica granatum TaxID=22663 RepID=A0A2I0J7F1_PUNGR|nr:hypothetical protein CRG98_027434 [Punica granatum]
MGPLDPAEYKQGPDRPLDPAEYKQGHDRPLDRRNINEDELEARIAAREDFWIMGINAKDFAK